MRNCGRKFETYGKSSLIGSVAVSGVKVPRVSQQFRANTSSKNDENPNNIQTRFASSQKEAELVRLLGFSLASHDNAPALNHF
jgi:hypothetical protein